MRFPKLKDWIGFCDRHNQWILLIIGSEAKRVKRYLDELEIYTRIQRAYMTLIRLLSH